MKKYKVVYSSWNGYNCGCCSEINYFDKIYESETLEVFLKLLEKEIKNYFWQNKQEGNCYNIVEFSEFYEITNNDKTITKLDDSIFRKRLTDLKKQVDDLYEKNQKRKEKLKIKKAIAKTELKIRENFLQKELEELKETLKNYE